MAKAFQFLEANKDMIAINVYQNPAQDFYYEVRFRVTALSLTSARMGNAIAPRIVFGYNDTTNSLMFTIGNVSEDTGNLALNQWTKMRLEYTGSIGRFSIWQDDVLVTNARGATVTTGLTIFTIGKYIAASSGDFEIDYLNMNGILFDFETLTNNHTQSSDGKWHPIISDRANINDMQITI